MRLGINATGLYPGKVGGAEQYLRNIINQLSLNENIITYLFVNDTAFDTFEENNNLKLILIDLSYNHDAQLKNYIKLYDLDVWFCPFFHLIPIDCGIPNATTIFDIQQDYYPENFDKKTLRNRINLTKQTVQATDLVLTISEYSKKTLIDKYRLPEDEIKVTYLDADSSFNNSYEPEKIANVKKKLPFPYILFPANMWPHKNHVNLIKGFTLAKKLYNIPLKLVFTGSKERETKEIEKAIIDNGVRDDVVYLGYIPQDDMRYIFKNASMLAFPSKFEGFGIPLVEAMASGIPIICSHSTCVPEIVGDAAVLFNENNIDEIAYAINMVYSDTSLRNKLISNGIERRKLFSWDICAKDTVMYLQSLYKEKVKKNCYFSDNPKVSIITPSYNQGEFIKETIESVLNQTYKNIEYIVMDGGSTDDTVEILKSYGNRIKWISEKDKGQADAVNKGLEAATGEIIGWLNSDDTYYPDTIKTVVEYFLSNQETDMIYGEGDYIDRYSEVIGKYDTKIFDYSLLANECFICQPAAFFTKSIVDSVGRLNADLQLCMDYELWMRIGKFGNVLYVPETLATSRMYDENKTLSRRREVYEECCKVLKKHYGYVSHNWLVGYATYLAENIKKINRKYIYLYLFLRYNWDKPLYFKECLKQYLKAIIQYKTVNVQENVSANSSTSLYADGWMGKELIKTLRCSDGDNLLLVEGRNLLEFKDTLVLTFDIDGVQRSYPIKQIGDFKFSFYVSNKIKKCKLKIISNQVVIPAEINKDSSDIRELSVIIDKILIKKANIKDKPLVSIITPSYNQGKFIKNTIDSVLSQDYPRIEYIVVDGGSTDDTIDILKEYGDKIHWISEKDKGQADAINKGFKMAKGEYVAWLNSDDIYEPECIKKAVEALVNNPNVAFVYGDGYIRDYDGDIIKKFEYTRPFDMWSLVNIWDYIMQPTVFMRKSCLESIGWLKEDLNWIMDWDIWVRLSDKYDVFYLPEILASSREYGETKTSTGNEKRLKEIYNFMCKTSKNKNPFGYEIYYCSNLLANYKLEESRKDEVLSRLNNLIKLQPVPDKDNKCSNLVNFLIRPYETIRGLHILVDQEKPVLLLVSVNGRLVIKKKVNKGEHFIPVSCLNSENYNHIKVDIESEELNRITNQSDSWLRMNLVY